MPLLPGPLELLPGPELPPRPDPLLSLPPPPPPAARSAATTTTAAAITGHCGCGHQAESEGGDPGQCGSPVFHHDISPES
ncbi:hypothetical protein LP417_18960 [Polaromonas sp. P1-6]|nr:hypothetical protein LP417_18960 [Polaromonas sp. P1-6]